MPYVESSHSKAGTIFCSGATSVLGYYSQRVWLGGVMDTIRAALCDAEPEWLEQCRRILDSYAEQNKFDFVTCPFLNAASLLRNCEIVPDVLFCDIELGDGENGIALAREVGRVWPNCQIVYVTNSLCYAPEVYVTDHLWFVLKKDFERSLPAIIEKLLQRMESGSKALTLRTTSHELLSLPCAQIASLERRGRITTITLDGGTRYQVPDRLSDILNRLPDRLFARCHGSYAVGFKHVRLLKRDSLVVQGDAEIPLSRRYARAFRTQYLDWVEDHAL